MIYLQEIISRNTILPNFITQFGEFDDVGVREGTWGAEFHPDLVRPEPGVAESWAKTSLATRAAG